MAVVMPATVCASVQVSWSGSGAYDGPLDDVTARVAADTGLAITLGKDSARTLDPPQVASCDFELYNDDGRYSQYRADSPLYQLVVPGRPVRLVVTHGVADAYRADDPYRADDAYRGAAVYNVGAFAIDDISQQTAYGARRVTLNCLGVEQLLTAGTVTVGLMTAPRVDQCITALLDAVGWPSGARSIAVADTTLSYWWCDDRTPWDALVELLRSEGPGAIWIDNGVFHFENRNYRTTTTRSTTSRATFFDVGESGSSVAAYREDDAYRTDDTYRGATSGLWFTEFSYDPGYKNLRNRCTYAIKTRQLAALGVVWTYGATLALSGGASRTLIAHPNDPFSGAVTPVSGTDFTVSGGTVSVSLAASSGLVAFITLTATSGTPTVSGLQLRAQALTVIGETTVQNALDASASIAKYSPIPGANIPRVFSVEGWPEVAQAYAEAVCDSWVSRYMEPRPAVQITVENGDGDLVRQILDRTVSDRITLVERNSGLHGDVWVNSKRVEIGAAGGRRLLAVFGCELVENTVGSVWDGATWDVTDGTLPAGIWGR